MEAWFVEALPSVAVLALGMAVQVAVGFGSGMLAIPILLWLGVELPNAVGLMIGGTVVQTALGLWPERHRVDFRRTLRIGVGQHLGVLAGIGVMVWMTAAGPDRVKQGVGVFILSALLFQLVSPARRAHLPLKWEAATGLVSGIFSGAAGMGGPPLVVYALAHDWDKHAFRAFLWAQMLILQPFLVSVLAWRFGAEVLAWFALGIASVPVVWLTGKLALAATDGLDEIWIRRAARALLVVLAMSSIGGPLVRARAQTVPAAPSIQIATPQG